MQPTEELDSVVRSEQCFPSDRAQINNVLDSKTTELQRLKRYLLMRAALSHICSSISRDRAKNNTEKDKELIESK